MSLVVSNLSSVRESDVHAIASYMAGIFGAPTPDRKRRADEVLAQTESPRMQASQTNAVGASIYVATCATCHETERPLPYGGVNLGLSSAIASPDPRNLANIVLSGIRPLEGVRSPIMPSFADAMNDDQIAALLNYLRARFSSQPVWMGVEKTVADARRTHTVFLQTSPEPHSAPLDPMQRDKP
jgi:mono/diheme cytochrome c family protein